MSWELLFNEDELDEIYENFIEICERFVNSSDDIQEEFVIFLKEWLSE